MAEPNKIRQRSETAVEDTWALEDLYPTPQAWEQELATLAEDERTVASFASHLGEKPENLYTYLENMERIFRKTAILHSYSSCLCDQDTRNSDAQAMNGRFMTALVSLNTAASFAAPEIMAISDETLEDFYVRYPALERYRRYLTDMRRLKDHTLPTGEARLLASAGELAQSPSSVFSAFSNADLTYPDAVDSKGVHYPLSDGTFVPLEYSPDRELRRSAYETFYHTLGGFRNTAAALMNAQNKQIKFFAEAKGYDTAFEAALDENHVPTSVYLNLIEAVHQNLPKFHRYVRLRKKLLGVEELHFYDVYTSLLQGSDQVIPFEQAKQTVYEALAPMGEEYRKILKKGFESRWIDVYQNVGKRSGAYSNGCPVHPLVLLNYNGTLKGQFTLAHEMGHAIHSYLSNQHQNPIDARYVIFVAEVASTCNESLLMQYLLKKTTEKKQRAYLLNYFLEQLKGTVFRQTMFAEFELFMGRMTAQGKTLTADMLCNEYRRLNEQYFGPDMVADDCIAMEWARIPHFYYDYYVYQYATGISAAIAISRKILAEGESAVQKYLEFLSGGCSKSPIDLLKGVGVDMTSTQPVNDALALFGELLEELEALTAED